MHHYSIAIPGEFPSDEMINSKKKRTHVHREKLNAVGINGHAISVEGCKYILIRCKFTNYRVAVLSHTHLCYPMRRRRQLICVLRIQHGKSIAAVSSR